MFVLGRMGIHMKIDLDEVLCITETSITIRGTRRRTTVPKEIVDKLRLENGDKIRWILYRGKHIVMMKVVGGNAE